MTRVVNLSIRLTRIDKCLLSRLARSEHRTMSNFLVNLIHERQAQANRLQLDEIVPRGPLPRVRKGQESAAEPATEGKAVGK